MIGWFPDRLLILMVFMITKCQSRKSYDAFYKAAVTITLHRSGEYLLGITVSGQHQPLAFLIPPVLPGIHTAIGGIVFSYF